ncbi:MAG TPA: hypothetical protein VGY53_01645, partial [Isosphaeraceae bacterium]|nr:hypothetical protein [Isosphaeraceae bacterium]
KFRPDHHAQSLDSESSDAIRAGFRLPDDCQWGRLVDRSGYDRLRAPAIGSPERLHESCVSASLAPA